MAPMSGYTPNGPPGSDPYGLAPQGSGGYDGPQGGYESPPGGSDQFGQGHGGGYSGQAAPPPHQPYGQPPPSYGPPPHGGYGMPQPKKSSTGLVLGIVGGVLALLLIGGVGGFFLLRSNRPDQMVLDYFAALQAGDADQALSFAQQRPSDTSLLTDEVLRKSNELGAIRNVEISSRSGSTVRVNYQIDGSPAFATLQVTETNDGWKLRTAAFPISVMARSDAAPLLLNGVEVVEGAVAFPGVYEVDTGSQHLSWNQDEVVIRADDAAVLLPLTLTISDDGEEAARDAIRATWDTCMEKRELKPKGCPFQMELDGTVKSDTIRWSAEPHPADVWQMAPLTDPTKVSGPVSYGLRLVFDYTRGGESYTYDKTVTLRLSVYFDFTEDELQTHWES